MKELKNFVNRIYGFDTLSFGLLFASALLFGLLGLLPVDGLSQYHLVGYLPLFLCIYRVFSSNTLRRQMENERFESVVGPMFDRIRNRREKKAQKKMFRFYHCPVCSQMLRVPKGKGRVEITCPDCNHKFIRNA